MSTLLPTKSLTQERWKAVRPSLQRDCQSALSAMPAYLPDYDAPSDREEATDPALAGRRSEGGYGATNSLLGCLFGFETGNPGSHHR